MLKNPLDGDAGALLFTCATGQFFILEYRQQGPRAPRGDSRAPQLVSAHLVTQSLNSVVFWLLNLDT